MTKLLATIRWLAGGSYLDIAAFFGLSPACFFHPQYFLWECLEAIDSVIPLGFSFDEEDLKRTSEGFAKFSGGHLKNCVMAVDGWVCKTRQPTRKEVGPAVASYRNRKQCFGIVVLAGCDADCRFTMLSVKSSGSTHDCTAWDSTIIKQYIMDNHLLPLRYYVIGDDAFACHNQFLTPYSGSGLTCWEDSFNYYLSSMRQCIERAFGMLTKRWGIFWRPLTCQFNRWSLVITVAAKLHNYCIDAKCGDSDDEVPDPLQTDVQHGDVWEVLDNNNNYEEEHQTNVFIEEAIGRRELLKSELQFYGILRPEYVMT
jgi:hypothetical protein